MSSGEQRALPFITVDDAGQFVIGEEAAARLSEIDLPIAVVAVAGEYRTGKSYLMNCQIVACGPFDQVHSCTGKRPRRWKPGRSPRVSRLFSQSHVGRT